MTLEGLVKDIQAVGAAQAETQRRCWARSGSKSRVQNVCRSSSVEGRPKPVSNGLFSLPGSSYCLVFSAGTMSSFAGGGSLSEAIEESKGGKRGRWPRTAEPQELSRDQQSQASPLATSLAETPLGWNRYRGHLLPKPKES